MKKHDMKPPVGGCWCQGSFQASAGDQPLLQRFRQRLAESSSAASRQFLLSQGAEEATLM